MAECVAEGAGAKATCELLKAEMPDVPCPCVSDQDALCGSEACDLGGFCQARSQCEYAEGATSR